MPKPPRFRFELDQARVLGSCSMARAFPWIIYDGDRPVQYAKTRTGAEVWIARQESGMAAPPILINGGRRG